MSNKCFNRTLAIVMVCAEQQGTNHANDATPVKPMLGLLNQRQGDRTMEIDKCKSKEENISELIKKLNFNGWTLSDEREYVENLFIGRFSNFLIIFSLFVTAGFANTMNNYKEIVFYAGAVFLFTIWLILYRGYKKHDKILKILFNTESEHPVYILQKIMKAEGYNPKYTVTKMMGIYLPWFCIIFLF